MSDAGIPQWKSWYRWPLLLPLLGGVWMMLYGIRECLTLVEQLRTLPRVIEVNTAMSAFPPLSIGFIVFGGLGWMPRKADNSGLRPIKIFGSRKRDPGAIMVVVLLVALLLYPVAGITLRMVTSDMLSARGYSEKIERTRPTSSYIVSRWTR